MQRIIIDGYNLIHTDDHLRRKAVKDLDAARAEFLERLRGYVQTRRVDVTVVFDGRGGLVDSESVVPGKLRVSFSPQGQTADDVIVSVVRGAASPKSYIVVTSDMAGIGGEAKRLGCEVIRAGEFLQRLGYGTTGRSSDEKPDRASDLGDTDYWLRRFLEGEDGES